MITKLRSSCSYAFAAIVILMLLPGIGRGQTVVTVGGGASVTCPATPTATWTTPPTGVTFSNWSRGSGVTCGTASTALNGSGFNAASAAAGYTANAYYKVTISADATHNFSLNSISWITQLSGTTNSCKFTIECSNNGAAPAVFGTAAQSITSSGSQTTFTFNGTVSVVAGTSLDIYLIPHQATASGTTARFVNGSTFTVTAVSSSSSSSDILANTSFTYPANIAYNSYQGTTPLTTGNSIEVGQFDIRDGGSAFIDADALGTTLTGITLNVADPGSIRRIALFDGSANVGEVAGGATATFSGLTLAAADNASKTFSVRVSYINGTVTDNQQYSFTVSSATASGSGSAFAAGNAGGAVTSIAGDNNRIEVTASDIIFDQNVSLVAMGAIMSPSPALRAIDANVNYDLDYTGAYTVAVSTGAATFDGTATTTGSFSSGVATLSNLKFNASGTGNNITVTSGSFTYISSAFDVTNPQPEINVKQNTTAILSAGNYDFGSVNSGGNSGAITFTVENLGSAVLSLNGIPIITKTGTNASEFLIDQTATSATVGVGSTTTFTITFSPTSQGAKTAQISIANNDASGSENPYIINLLGTATVSLSSDIVSTSGYSYSSNVPYSSFQTAATLATGNSVGVNSLTIRDGGSSTDADNLGTTLTAISFSTGGSTAIRTAALFVGSSNVSEVVVNGATTISFTGLTLAATDNGTKNFELRVTYQVSVTDNQQITFTVSSATASASGSNFANASAGGAASAIAGDDNRIEVMATKLLFVQQPTNTSIGINMTPSVTVKATDANNITDFDFVSGIDITSTGTLSSSPQTATAIAGIATFTSISHTVAATGATLNASSGLLTGVSSNSFNITTLPLVAWQFGSPASTGDEATYNATTNNTNLNTVILSRGGGITATTLARGFSSNAWDINATKPTAVSTNEYYQFSIQAKANYKVSLTTLNATLRRSSTGPNAYIWKYSTDGSTFNEIGNEISFTSIADGVAQTAIDLSVVPALQNVTSSTSITFRLYAWGGTSLTSTFAIARYAAGITTNCLAIDGNVSIVPPTVTTQSSSGIDVTSATGNGNITNIGGASPTTRGFCWDLSTNADPTTSLSTKTAETGTFTTGTFTGSITGLSQNSSYKIRAYAINGGGTSYGSVLSFTTLAATSTYTGTGNWSVSGNWSNGIPTSANDAIVDGNVTIDVAAETKALTINTAKSVTISDTKSLTVNGALTNSAGTYGLIVNSGGSLIQNSPDVNATVNRTITDGTDNNYHYFISPITTSVQAAAGSCFDGAYLDRYNESLGKWEYLVTGDDVTPDMGYELNYLHGTNTLVFPGTLKTSPVSFSNLSYTGSTPTGDYGSGWHLIGNPYTCGINTALCSIPTGMNAFAYVWNGSNYVTHAIGSADIAGTIASLQGFFVRSTSGTNSLTLVNAAKVHGGTFYKSSNSVSQMLSLSIEGNNYSDKTYVRFNTAASANFDQAFDAYKRTGIDAAPQLYSILPDEKAAVNTLPDYIANPNVSLGLKVGAETTYTVNVSGIENFDASLPIRLDDLKTGVSQDLRINPVYSFTAAPGDAENRFMLSFASVTGLDKQNASGINVTSANGIIRVTHNAPASGTVYLYSVSGQLLATSTLNAGETTLRTSSNGVFLVRVVTGKTSLTRKMVVVQ